jgi:hypothetical protein
MEERISRVESIVGELNVEMKVMNNTLLAISKTLTEVQKYTKELEVVRTNQALTKQSVDDNKGKVIRLGVKVEKLGLRVSDIERSDAIQGIRLGTTERFIWLAITIVTGFIVAKVKVL